MLPARKRMLDLVLAGVTAPLWLPLLALVALIILVFDGRPVWYVSRRRVGSRRTVPLLKLRTMVRNAERVANRDTMPVEEAAFLNIPKDSPLYTRVGRRLEQFSINELPQLIHVLAGDMSLVGNRPLPENVIAALASRHDNAEDRFLTRAGATGLVQLVGRERLSDAERLRLEGDYCRAVLSSYSVGLDLAILANTLFVMLRLRRRLSLAQAHELLRRYQNGEAPVRSGEPLAVSPASGREES